MPVAHADTLAWAAGVFEAKGTATLIGGRPRLAVKSQDSDLIRRFAWSVAVGRVYGPYGPYRSQMGVTVYFLWAADGDLARAASARLWPWLGQEARDRIDAIT